MNPRQPATLQVRTAESADLANITRLLKACELPHEDCAQHIEQFLVGEVSGQFVACGCIQALDNCGLLRSLAVSPSNHGAGIGSTLFNHLLEQATTQRYEYLYLLTESATDYFKRFGFEVIARDQAPVTIISTEQFSRLCPQNATLMRLRL